MASIRYMIIFTFIAMCTPINVSRSHPSSGPGTAFDLVHRDRILAPQQTRAERLRQMLHKDKMRGVLSPSRRQRDNVVEPTGVRAGAPKCDNAKVTAVTTIGPGADYGIGEFFVKLRVGTPAQDVLMVPDTGSDLNLLKCNFKGKKNPLRPVFVADRSSSFRGLPCASKLCSYNLTFLTQKPRACLPIYPARKTCAYSNYSYAGGSVSTSGIFALESFTFGRKKRVLKHMLIGCATSGKGLEVINRTHGILGLSNSPLSFSALASQLFGNRFSMCLVDHLSSRSNSSGKFIFGSVPKRLLPNTIAYTGLDTFWMVPFYALNVTGIYINGRILDIPPATWNVSDPNGGAIVDTGTSLTYLSNRAYGPVTAALNKSLSRFLKPVNNDEDPSFKYCYKSKGYKESLVPKLEIGFQGGARLKPFPDSYLIDFDPDTKCLGFVDAGATYSTLGNILLQKHFLMFDVDNGIFGFGRSSCA